MINIWPFKKKEKIQTDPYGLPYITNTVPMPKVKSQKNVSEPVISFVDCFKSNPKRFKIKTNPLDNSISISYIEDRVTKDIWTFCIQKQFIGYESYLYVLLTPTIPWLTKEEQNYLYKNISSYYQERKDRVAAYKENKERKRITAIYKGEQ